MFEIVIHNRLIISEIRLFIRKMNSENIVPPRPICSHNLNVLMQSVSTQNVVVCV